MKIKFGIALLVTVLSFASTSYAKQIVYKQTIGVAGNHYAQFSLKLFNPEIGNLRQATFKLSGYSQIWGSWDLRGYNYPPDRQISSFLTYYNSTEVEFGRFLDLQSVTGSLNLNPPHEIKVEKLLYAEDFGSFDKITRLYPETSTVIDKYDLQTLTGVGSFDSIAMGYLGSFVDYYVEPYYSADVSSAVIIDASVIYDYSVPEPDIWVLMMVGFGAVGSVTRRKNSAERVRRRAGFC